MLLNKGTKGNNSISKIKPQITIFEVLYVIPSPYQILNKNVIVIVCLSTVKLNTSHVKQINIYKQKQNVHK